MSDSLTITTDFISKGLVKKDTGIDLKAENLWCKSYKSVRFETDFAQVCVLFTIASR